MPAEPVLNRVSSIVALLLGCPTIMNSFRAPPKCRGFLFWPVVAAIVFSCARPEVAEN